MTGGARWWGGDHVMRDQAATTGRDAPTGGSGGRRAPGGRSAPGGGDRSGRGGGEQLAIVGGSAVAAIVGRGGRRYAIADTESVTAAFTAVPVPRGERTVALPGRAVPPDGPRGEGPRAGRPGQQRPAAPARHEERGAASTSLLRRRPSPVGWGIAAGAVVAAGVVVAALLWPAPAPTPTAAPFGVEVVAAAPPAAGPTGQPGLQSADPEPYLNALRAAAVPVSVSGQAEVEAAAAICDQLQRGVDPAELARAVPAMLSTLTPEQAPLVVELAAQHYCH